MLIMGVDYHPSFQQVAFLNQDTGEYGERSREFGSQVMRTLYGRQILSWFPEYPILSIGYET
jgi:hypothetical protein